MKTRKDISDHDLVRECLRETLLSFLRSLKSQEGFEISEVSDFLVKVIPIMKGISPDPHEERMKAIEYTLKDLMSFKALMVAKNQLKVFQGGGTSTIGAT